MPKAKGEDLRWLVVYKRVVEELPIDTIALECRVCATFVKDIVSLFHRTNGVESRQGVRDAPPANLVMTQEAAQTLWRRILDSPQTTRQEHRLQLLIDGVVDTLHVSTVCRACLAMNVSGGKLRPTGRKARRTPPALAPRADTARTSRTTNDLRGGVGGPEDKHVYAQRTARCGEVWRGLEQSAWLSTVTCCVPSVECARSVTPSAPPASALPATCPTRAPLVARRRGLPGGGLKPTVKNTETWKSICAGVHTCCVQRALSRSLWFFCVTCTNSLTGCAHARWERMGDVRCVSRHTTEVCGGRA